MIDFFFYGTLLDDAVRATVVGRALPREEAAKAVLSAYRRVSVRGATYPAIRRDPRAQAPGLVFRGLHPREAARLSHFEGDGYEACRLPVALETGVVDHVWVFVPVEGVPVLPRPWDFESWARRHCRRYLASVRRYVREVDPGELAVIEREWRRQAAERDGRSVRHRGGAP